MRVICVDDEPLTLEYTAALCGQLFDGMQVEGYAQTEDVIANLSSKRVDIALLDINMPGMNGIELAAVIKEAWPCAAILFLTAYREYAFDAYAVHPTGYLLKPVTWQALETEIGYALSVHPPRQPAHIQAITFGNFELLVDGNAVVFKRSKSKELLAYLIDRQGTSVTRREIFSILFEDKPYAHAEQKYLDVIIRSLRDTLRSYGISGLMQMRRTGIRIVPELLDCDMYRFCRGESDAINAYRGEYMTSYAWASLKEAYLDVLPKKN